MNEKYWEVVKKWSIDKNVLDVIYKEKVKKVGLFKYYMNEVFRE